MSQVPFRITRVSARARKFLMKRDRKTQEEIAAAFAFISNESPFHHPNPKTIKRLHGPLEGFTDTAWEEFESFTALTKPRGRLRL